MAFISRVLSGCRRRRPEILGQSPVALSILRYGAPRSDSTPRELDPQILIIALLRPYPLCIPNIFQLQKLS